MRFVVNKYILFSDGKSPHTLKWLKELIKYFDVYLVSLNGYDNDVLEYINKDKIYILNNSVDTSGGNFRLLLKYFDLKKIIDTIKPTYLNAHYLSSYGFIASLIKKTYPNIKLIQSTWGTDILVTPYQNIIKKSITKFALQNSDLITSDSYFMSDKIEEIYPNNKTMTFAFGLLNFDIDSDIQKDKFLIYSNRALSANYNIDKIIIWFSKIQDTRYKLLIAHDGDKRESLENLVEKLDLKNRVSFVGFLNEKEQEINYKKAKYYISIPTSDSTAVSLLEAMRYGCYPIVSNLSANREWIIDEFNGSFYFEDIQLPDINKDVININQNIIQKKAIFSNSINQYINKLEEILKF